MKINMKSTVRIFFTAAVLLTSMFMLTACDDLISGLFPSSSSVAAEEAPAKLPEPTQITADGNKIADEEMPMPSASSDAGAEENIVSSITEPSLYSYSDYFTLTFPSSWEGKYHIEEYKAEQDHNGRIEISHADAWEANGGGVIGTIIIYPSELWEEYKTDAFMFTSFGEKGGLSFVYTLASDVQYDSSNDILTEEYNAMCGELPEILKNADFSSLEIAETPDISANLLQKTSSAYNPDSIQEYFFTLQRNAENGEESWRLNPEEVARKFAAQTLNFKGTGVLARSDENEPIRVKESERVTFTKESGEVIAIDLYQPAIKGQGGIWDIECWYDENNACHQVRDLAALPPLFYNDENVPQKIREAVRNAVVSDWTEVYKVYYSVLGFYATGVSYTADGDTAEVKFIMAMVTQNEKDPDTVGYIKEAKESGSEYYQQLYDEYSMPQTGNFDLKVTMSLDASGEVLPDTVQVFSNDSPVGEEYVLTKAEDFLPK